MANIAIFASGNGSNFEVLAKSFMNDDNNNVKILICNKKNAFVFKRAKKLNIPYALVEYKEKIVEAESKIINILVENSIDVIFLAGFMKILSSEFIDIIDIPIINIHPALLPKYKGVNSIERAFNSGDKEIGISIHYVIAKVDSGRIILQESIPLDKKAGLKKVEEDVHKLEHKWYPIVAKDICDKINNKIKKY